MTYPTIQSDDKVVQSIQSVTTHTYLYQQYIQIPTSLHFVLPLYTVNRFTAHTETVGIAGGRSFLSLYTYRSSSHSDGCMPRPPSDTFTSNVQYDIGGDDTTVKWLNNLLNLEVYKRHNTHAPGVSMSIHPGPRILRPSSNSSRL
jgi:hypothetical protein